MAIVFERWRKSRFIRNVAKLSSGRFAALAIGLVSTPVVARLFEPEHYGIAALFVAYISLTGILLPLSYNRAVIFPKSDTEAKQLFVLAILVSIAIALLIYISIGLATLIGANFAEKSGMGGVFWLFPVGAVLFSLGQTVGSVCLRRQDFSALATRAVVEKLVVAGTRILWGLLLTSSVVGLVLGHLFGVAVGILICLLRSLPWLRTTVAHIDFRRLRALAADFRDYPLLRQPANLAFAASRQLPLIALGMLFSPAVVGLYAMANRLVNLPLQATSRAVSTVLLSTTMRRRHKQQAMAGNIARVVVVLVAFGLPVFSLVSLFGEEFLSWFLGERWRSAGEIAEVLAPYLFLVLVSAFSPTVLETLRLNKLRLMIHTGNLTSRAVVFTVCGLTGVDFPGTLKAFVAVSCAYQVLIIAVSGWAVMQHDRGLNRTDFPGDSIS